MMPPVTAIAPNNRCAALPSHLALRIPTALGLDDERLFAICQANPELRIERNAHGDLEIMPPTGAETGARNAELILEFGLWARQDGRGRVFDSSTGFLLPNGAMRSPDVAWVQHDRLAAVSPAQKRQFLPLAPDVVIELASPSDAPESLFEKMREWRDNGTSLGWLILPEQRQVWCYPADTAPILLEQPNVLSNEELLPGLAIPLAEIWVPRL